MRLIVAIAYLLSSIWLTGAHAAPVENWNKPGENPYIGSRSSAVMSYKFSVTDRVLLTLAVLHRKPTDRVQITRDAIVGDPSVRYSAALNGMHFGKGQHAGDDISRAGWAYGHSEPASMWCLPVLCIVIPDICGNVSWTVRELLPQHGLVNKVPEPKTIWMVLAGLVLLAGMRIARQANARLASDALMCSEHQHPLIASESTRAPLGTRPP